MKRGMALRIFILAAVLVLVALVLTCDPSKGIITGSVHYLGQPCGGAYVLLLDEGSLISFSQPLENGTITFDTGGYIIINVKPDTYYYVVAVKDLNGDLKYTPGTDAVGYYGDYDGLKWLPKSLSVPPGQTVSGIDINELYVLPF